MNKLSRLQSFTNVQAPILARPPDCSYRCSGFACCTIIRFYDCWDFWASLVVLLYNTRYKAAGTYTPRNGRVVTQHELWYHYASESSNWCGGTFTHKIKALSAATLTPGSLSSELMLRRQMLDNAFANPSSEYDLRACFLTAMPPLVYNQYSTNLGCRLKPQFYWLFKGYCNRVKYTLYSHHI